jgi:hypothetical protein
VQLSMLIIPAGDEVHLYVVPATNLSLATVGRAKRPQQLE